MNCSRFQRFNLFIILMFVLSMSFISLNTRRSDEKDTIQEHIRRVILEETNRNSIFHQRMLESLGKEGNQDNREHGISTAIQLPTIYGVTPTFFRPQQIPELTRLSQTLMQVPNFFWIIGEDSDVVNPQLQEFVDNLKIPHVLLLTPMPEKFRENSIKPRGVAARNAGIKWLQEHADDGVMYFMDDDNTYDLRLFQEMRWTKKVAMWPVGLVTQLALSSPILKNGRHMGWYDGYIAGRKFPVDMAGFAVNVRFLKQVENPTMPFVPGREEDGFLKSLKIEVSDIEFKADGCTKIYVWHTKTVKTKPASRVIHEKEFNGTNVRALQNYINIESQPQEGKSFDKEIKSMFVNAD